MFSETEWAYMAGIIDGEGCIHVAFRPSAGNTKARGGRWSTWTNVSVASTDKALVDWIHERWGGSISHRAASGNNRESWNWSIDGHTVDRVLRGVYPYLVIKREQADVALSMRRRIWAAKPGFRRPLGDEEVAARLALADQAARLKRRKSLV